MHMKGEPMVGKEKWAKEKDAEYHATSFSSHSLAAVDAYFHRYPPPYFPEVLLTSPRATRHAKTSASNSSFETPRFLASYSACVYDHVPST